MTTQGGNRTLMRFIVSTSLRFRFLVVAAATAMMVVGILQIQRSEEHTSELQSH